MSSSLSSLKRSRESETNTAKKKIITEVITQVRNEDFEVIPLIEICLRCITRNYGRILPHPYCHMPLDFYITIVDRLRTKLVREWKLLHEIETVHSHYKIEETDVLWGKIVQNTFSKRKLKTYSEMVDCITNEKEEVDKWMKLYSKNSSISERKNKRLLEALETISEIPMSVKILKATRIGETMKFLSKIEGKDDIKEIAADLRKKWREHVDIVRGKATEVVDEDSGNYSAKKIEELSEIIQWRQLFDILKYERDLDLQEKINKHKMKKIDSEASKIKIIGPRKLKPPGSSTNFPSTNRRKNNSNPLQQLRQKARLQNPGRFMNTSNKSSCGSSTTSTSKIK